MVFIVLYVYGIYSIHLLQTMSLKSGRVAREACLPGSLLKHNTTRQNPLIELLLFFFCAVSESLLRFAPAQSARSVSSALVEAFHISLSLLLSFSLSTYFLPCFFWATLPWYAKKCFEKKKLKLDTISNFAINKIETKHRYLLLILPGPLSGFLFPIAPPA